MSKKRKSGNPAKRVPHGAEVSGSTTLTFGCEDCPARREVVIGVIGGLSMQSDPSPIPFGIKTHMNVTVPGCKPIKMDIEVIGYDQQSCDRQEGAPCADASFIELIAGRIATHPKALEWSMDPHVTPIRIEPPHTNG